MRKKLADYTKNTGSSTTFNNLGGSSPKSVVDSSIPNVNNPKSTKSNSYDEEFEKYMHPNRTVDAPLYPHVLPLEWVGTIYDRYVPAHNVIKKDASASLMDCTAIDDLGYVSIIVYCQMVDIKGNKARLRVSDPYACVWTEPMDIRNNYDMTVFNGNIVRILGFANHGKLHVDRVQNTRYKKNIS